MKFIWLLIHLYGLTCLLERIVVLATAIACTARNCFHHQPIIINKYERKILRFKQARIYTGFYNRLFDDMPDLIFMTLRTIFY